MEHTKEKVKKKEEMVEQMGVVFEQRGLTPMHGRVFAYLLLAEPPYKDFYEIQEFLKASKSAISNAIKFLMDRNLVKYITFSGDRRRYFQANIEGWLEQTAKEIGQATVLKDLIVETLEARKKSKHLDFNEELENMVDFHNELTEVLNDFIANWRKKRE